MIGLFGGSGLYNFLDNPDIQSVQTYYGKVEVEMGSLNGNDICFIPRHGKDHSIPPHLINYRANVLAASIIGVTSILVTNAVGALSRDFDLGQFVLPNQVLDFTKNRSSSFMDDMDRLSTIFPPGDPHTDVTVPFDPNLRQEAYQTAQSLGLDIVDGATIVVTEGPRFETPAEIELYRRLGADIVGMTTAPEIFLAAELGIPYTSLAVITNYAAGMQAELSDQEVFDLFKENMIVIKDLLFKIIDRSHLLSD